MDKSLVPVNLKDVITGKVIKVFLTTTNAEKTQSDPAYGKKIIDEIKSHAQSRKKLYTLPLNDRGTKYNLLLSEEEYNQAKNDLQFATHLLEMHKSNCPQGTPPLLNSDSPAHFSSQQTKSSDITPSTTMPRVKYSDVGRSAMMQSKSTIEDEFVLGDDTLPTISEQKQEASVSIPKDISTKSNSDHKNLVSLKIFEEDTNITYNFELPRDICEKVILNPLLAKEMVKQFKKSQQQKELLNDSNKVENTDDTLELCKKKNAYTVNKCSEDRCSWSDEETFLLLDLYKNYEKELGDNIIFNQLYAKLEKDMKKNYPEVDSTKCRIKIDTLKREYRRVKIHNEQKENKPIKWKFYEVMEELFGKKPWLRKRSIPLSVEVTKESSPNETTPNKRAKVLSEFEAQQLELAKRRLELKERQYAEKNTHRREKNDLLKDLVNKLRK